MKNIAYPVLSFLMVVAPISSVQAASFEKPPTEIPVQISAPVAPVSLNEVLSGLSSQETLQAVVAVPKKQPEKPKSPETLKEVAKRLVTQRFGSGQVSAFEAIITQESQWDPSAVNTASGACGLGQFLPCKGLNTMSPETQLTRTLDYIADRYGTPSQAWSFHLMRGWY